jgi:DNA helicase-2/ATP-dependent DNA helicase PcrA
LTAFEAPPRAREGWHALREVMAQLRTQAAGWPDEVAVVRHWYGPQLERLHADARVRQADLSQLARIAAGYASRERFLTELTLDPPQATSDEAGPPLLDEDYLILSTIHSAKGQEWQSVHVLNVVDGCIPADLSVGSAAQVEEERRLLYVAMTRARQHLHLLVPQRFYITQQGGMGDRHVYGSLTRFIPPEVATAFEQIGPRRTAPEPHLSSGAVCEAPLDLASRARAAW